MPSAKFNHSAVAPRPIDEVWQRLQQAETWSAIGPIEKVFDPVHHDGELRSFRWTATVGPTAYRGNSTVTAAERPASMRLVLDAGEVAGELIARLLPEGPAATRLDITMEVTARGVLSSMFFPAIAKAVGSGLPAQVESFAASLVEE